MKAQAVVILIVLAFGVLAPVSFAPLPDRHASASLVVLDVCQSASPAVSGGDMPCLAAFVFQHIPTPVIQYHTASKPLFAALLMTGGAERPPAA